VVVAERTTDRVVPSRLDTATLPIEALARLAGREARRPNPIYGAHRWFARRLGTAMRALLVASAMRADEDFWAAFDGEADLGGVTVLDPFMGGGTTLVEASRLGATVHGIDIDPVACAVSAFQMAAATSPDLRDSVMGLIASVGTGVKDLYQTRGSSGELRDVIHWFWVQVVTCATCGVTTEAHPHYRLAVDQQAGTQTVFCPSCHTIADVDIDAASVTCKGCARDFAPKAGSVTRGKFTCPGCGTAERLIDVAKRTHRPPEWRLLASESVLAGATKRTATLAHRQFLPASDADQATYETAELRLAERSEGGWPRHVPSATLPEGSRQDDRLDRYGYRTYADLFNRRQLLHLSLLSEAIATWPGPERTGLAIAFSDHLTTNCMLTAYAFGWRRLSPLFAIRGYRHIVRPVEVNPWLDGIGRGTFPNAARQVDRAIAEARRPRTIARDADFIHLPVKTVPAPVVECRDSRSLPSVETGSVDLVLTDPPYLDYVAYGELADFYRPWMQALGVLPDGAAGTSLAIKSRDAVGAAAFEAGLREVLLEVGRVLRPDGRVAFTFRHETDAAYASLEQAIRAAGLRAVSCFPLRGDGGFGLHIHDGSTSWDSVFVLAMGPVPAREENPALDEARVLARTAYWTDRLRSSGLIFGSADERVLIRALRMASRLGA
jgi:putative DNA methylase